MKGNTTPRRDNQRLRIWVRIAILTALGAFLIETVHFIHANIFGDKVSIGDVPWTFHTLWELAVLFLAFLAVSQLTEHIVPYLAYLFIGFVLGNLCMVLWLGALPTWNLFHPNYYGIEIRKTLNQHEEESGEFTTKRVYDRPLWLTILYPKEATWSMEASIDDWKREGYEHVEAKGFITWQAGLAYGFEPSSTFVPSFKTDGILNRLILVITVGPVTLFELLIRGMYQYFFPLLIPQIAWYWGKRQTFCDERATKN